MKNLTFLAILIAALFLLAGCGGGDDAATTAEEAAPATEAAPAETAPAEAEAVAAVHDCAGGCGMKAMPEDKMTEVDGKFYCAGCAKKAQEAAKGQG